MPHFHRPLFIHISYHLAISVHSQFVFKMPSPTNGSLKLFTYPPVHKDIPTELYSAGVPLIAERIFSLLNPTDLCSCLQVSTTWNYQVSSVPNSWTKSLSTGGSARRMLKTIMHLRSRWRSLCFPLRGNHLLLSPPTLWCKSRRPKRHVQPLSHSSASNLFGTRVGAVGE